MQVKFRVFEPNTKFPNPGTPILEYTLEVQDPKHFEEEYQQSRKVWAEYQVEAAMEGGFTRGESETYKEQLRREEREEIQRMMLEDRIYESRDLAREYQATANKY